MEFGAHLPLIGAAPTLAGLRDYARTAAALGYRYLCANDHLLFARPWLDGPTALAAVLDAADGMTIATTVALPVIRGPAQTAKLLSALDVLSRRPAPRRCRAGIVTARLRGGRDRVRRALATLRRVGPRPARAAAP